MEFLGVGPLEFLLILAIMLIVLGPRDMAKTTQKAAQWIRRLVQSPQWREMLSTTREIRELPQKFVRESGLEDDLREIRTSIQPDRSTYEFDPLRSIHPQETPPTVSKSEETSAIPAPDTRDQTAPPPGGRA